MRASLVLVQVHTPHLAALCGRSWTTTETRHVRQPLIYRVYSCETRCSSGYGRGYISLNNHTVLSKGGLGGTRTYARTHALPRSRPALSYELEDSLGLVP